MEITKPVAPRLPGTQGLGRRLLNTPELGVGIAIVVFFLMFTALDRSMATPDGFVLLFTQVTYMGFAAFGMSHLMLAGEIDLSTGSVAALAAAVAAKVIAVYAWPEWSALLLALAVAVLCGLINSFIVLKVGVPSFFATLGTHFMIFGIMMFILQGQWVAVDKKIPLLTGMAAPSPLGVPWTFLIYVIAVIVADFLIRRSKLGPILSATGGNRRAAEISGINTARVKTLCFVLVSICAAIGGLLVMRAGGAADPAIGDGWQLWVIAIAVIGGSSFGGGLGSILGGFLGALLIQVIKLGLGAAQIKTNAQGVVVGAILIASAVLDVVRRRIKQY